jgi:hypothetical protein
MLKTMIVHTLFVAVQVGLAAASGAVADFVVYVRAAACFFSVRRETSGNLSDKEDGHEDAAATPMRSGGNTLHRGSACGPAPGKRHGIWL